MADLGKSSAEPANDPARRLETLWREGQKPEVRPFVARAGSLSPGDLAGVLGVDQRERWLRGERVRAESYFEWFPLLGENAEVVLELIYGEYLVREQLGEAPALEEYCQRFPVYAARLRQQIELHQALVPRSSLEFRETASGSSTGVLRAVGPVSLPESFGRYRILKPLGQGGMGCVYLAHDTLLDRRVALKVPILGPNDSAYRERFLREARSAATLAHPNICSVHDVGQIDGICYLTMPYIEGQPLSKTGARMPQRSAVELVHKVALAMAEAHDHQIVHRDLKPANIMITPRGEPVVMDFGLALHSKPGDIRLTQAGSMLGTPGYMSPEQAAGDSTRVGPGSDIYSLGVILHELLTGHIPFEGDLSEILVQTLTEKPRPLSTYGVAVDPRLESICLQTLEKKPGDRPRTMRDLAVGLADWLDATPLTTQALPSVPRAGGSRAPGRRLRAVLGLVALVALGGGAVYLAFQRTPPLPTGLVSQRAAESLQTIAPLRTLAEQPGGVLCVAFVGDGSHAVSAGQDLTVRTWDLNTGQEAVADRRKLPLSSQFAFTPDGRRFAVDVMQSLEVHAVETGQKPRTINSGAPGGGPIAVAANGRRVIAARQATFGEPLALVWDLETDQIFRFKGHTEKIRCVALSPDGRQGLSAGPDGIRWWEVESGKELGRLDRKAVTCLAFAPDGAHALVGEDLGTLACWELKTGQVERKWEGHGDAVTCASYSPDGSRILSGSADNTVRLWDAGTGRELARLQGHTQKVTSVAFSPQGRHALSGGKDGSIRWWELPSTTPAGP